MRNTRTSSASVPLRSERFMRHAIELHRGAVIRLALGQTRSMADAQDIAQDVFIQLLKSTTAFADDAHLRAWLLRVTYNRCVDFHRQAWQRHVDARDSDELLVNHPCEDAAAETLFEHPVWTAMERLPEKLRVALHLHYVEGLTTDEAARIMGCLLAAARTRLHRGRKKLLAELKAGEAGSAPSAPHSSTPHRQPQHTRMPTHRGTPLDIPPVISSEGDTRELH